MRSINLPRAPLVGIDAITFVDALGAEQTLASGDFQIDASSQPARLAPVYAGATPILFGDLTAGYTYRSASDLQIIRMNEKFIDQGQIASSASRESVALRRTRVRILCSA